MRTSSRSTTGPVCCGSTFPSTLAFLPFLPTLQPLSNLLACTRFRGAAIMLYSCVCSPRLFINSCALLLPPLLPLLLLLLQQQQLQQRAGRARRRRIVRHCCYAEQGRLVATGDPSLQPERLSHPESRSRSPLKSADSFVPKPPDHFLSPTTKPPRHRTIRDVLPQLLLLHL